MDTDPCKIVPHDFSYGSVILPPGPPIGGLVHLASSKWYTYLEISCLWGVLLVPRLSTSWSSTSHDLVITGWWISQPSLPSPGCVQTEYIYIYFEIYFSNLAVLSLNSFFYLSSFSSNRSKKLVRLVHRLIWSSLAHTEIREKKISQERCFSQNLPPRSSRELRPSG